MQVTVIGAGLMGHGIAYLFAAAGHDVRVFDISPQVLDSVPARLQKIRALLGGDESVAKRITPHSVLAEAVDSADFVIEAAPEKLEIKQTLVYEIEPLMSAEAIFASNTSALPISQIAGSARVPERFVGTHFWNPPHLVRLVEVVQGEKTSADTIQRTMALLEDVGQFPVHVRKDIPGFIGNRLQHALKREAIALVARGVCDAKTVDDVVKHGFGKRMAVLGPMEQSDLVGLSLTADIHRTLMPDLDTTGTVHPYLQACVDAGHDGMVTGQGLRVWDDGEADEVRERLDAFLSPQK